MKKYILISAIVSAGALYLIYSNIKKIVLKSRESNNTSCPHRVVSLNIGLDEITYYVAREKIVGISYLSFEPKMSNIAYKLQNIKPMKVEINNILSIRPDLLLISKFSNTNFINVLVQNGVKVELFDKFDSLNDIEDNISKIADITCKYQNGRKLLIWIKSIKNRLKRKCAKIKNRYSSMYISYNLLSAGNGTIVSDILELACLKNTVKDAGLKGFAQLKLEDILKYNPDTIIFDDWVDINYFFKRFVSLNQLKAYQQKKIIQVESKFLMSTSHYSFLSAWILFNKIYSMHNIK